MITIRPTLLLSGLVLTLALSGCGGSGSGGGSGSSDNAAMFVQTCSLGCSSGQTGSQVSCALVSAYTNQDIAIYFSEEVDPSSINSSSIKLVDVNSGGVPTGQRFVDPLNPRKVIFRPSITIESSGTVSFGFADNRTYRILVPGTEQGDAGPFIRSRGGNSNQSRLQCEIQTSLGVTDFVPGPPSYEVRVDLAETDTPNPNDTIPNVIADDQVDVWRNSTIRILFNDLMNPATLAPGGVSSFVTVHVDLDGDNSTTSDRTPLFGTWGVVQDTTLLRTTMTFTGQNGLPSSGNPALGTPRKVVINVPADLRDLSDNGVANPTIPTDPIAFTPEYVALPAATLPDADGENFTNQDNYDAVRSSAEWGMGKVTRGFGGGSGRLGELVIKAGQTVTLNTDMQSFPLSVQAGYDILSNLTFTPPTPPPALVLTDGTFEFTSVRIAVGGTLLITGSKPARLMSRGSINVLGLLDVSGRNAAAKSSSEADGGFGGAGGPNAGAGGKGATRASTSVASLLALNPGAINITDPGITVNNTGAAGVGVVAAVIPPAPAPPVDATAGGGGVPNPAVIPTGTQTVPPTMGGLIISAPTGGGCTSQQVASPGGGGAYSTDGLPAVPATPTPTNPVGVSNFPSAIAVGGASSALGIEPPGAPVSARTLAPGLGLLRGGAGGGGGGQSMFGTDVGGFPPTNCEGASILLTNFKDHSAGGGGGGGGAIEIETGRTLTISGLVDASGGDGGSGTPPLFLTPPPPETRQRGASPGGGGAGGAVRALAQVIDMTGTTQPRIDVAGGVGGSNYINCRGGNGGLGLVRLEASVEMLLASTEAPHINPSDVGTVGPDSNKILTVGTWAMPVRRPECFTGANSCWIKPGGNFFQIVFKDDDLTPVDPAQDYYAWNMDLRYDSGGGEQLIKFRGPDPNLPFTPSMATPDFEHFLGNILNHGLPNGQGSYLAVRFQGAQSVGTLSQPCSVSLDPLDNQVLANSLTPWVSHPGQLNDFTPRPNMVRFCVVFDTQLALIPNSIPSFIKGVTNLKIDAQPD
jgi:hypothetical protein